MKTLLFTVQLALGILLPLLVQRWDRRRLSPAQRELTWSVSTWGAALYAFGPLSMLGWFWTSRVGSWPWWKRLLAGALATIVITAAIAGIEIALAAALRIPDE